MITTPIEGVALDRTMSESDESDYSDGDLTFEESSYYPKDDTECFDNIVRSQPAMQG